MIWCMLEEYLASLVLEHGYGTTCLHGWVRRTPLFILIYDMVVMIHIFEMVFHSGGIPLIYGGMKGHELVLWGTSLMIWYMSIHVDGIWYKFYICWCYSIWYMIWYMINYSLLMLWYLHLAHILVHGWCKRYGIGWCTWLMHLMWWWFWYPCEWIWVHLVDDSISVT
jgi:hypothetical protein